ncbi:MAG: redoxin domain-containing protein [Bacteroidia bacterium]
MIKNFLIYVFAAVAFFASSCQGDNKPSSGTSAFRVENDSKPQEETTIEVDNSDKTPVVVDSSNAETLFALEREKLEQKADEALNQREEKVVRVSGTIIGGAGMDITLDKLGGKTNMEPIKTTIINEDGYFELDATTSQEQIFSLRTDKGNMLLWLEGDGNYEVRANINELSKYQVNAPFSYKVREFYLILEEFNERHRKIARREDRYTKAKKAWKIQRVLDSMPYYNSLIEKERAKAIINFINNNRNNPFAAEAANRLDYLKHTKFINDLYQELVKDYPYSSYVKNVGLKLVDFKALAIGNKAPELVMPILNGDNYRLSDLKGKHVLLLFTLSYSDPCLDYGEDLVSIYNQYSSKGFEIYNVALDETREDWSYYINETGANWIVVSDQLGQKTTAFDYYIAHDYPMTYMIDDEGRIAAKFLTVQEVDQYLSENL